MFAFYIKYCVSDDFTKLYPGIMYFTLCEATDREENIADTYSRVRPFPCTRALGRISSRSVLTMCLPLCDSSRNIIYFILRSRDDRLASVSRSNAACPFAQPFQQPRYVITSIGRPCIVTYLDFLKVTATSTLKAETL